MNTFFILLSLILSTQHSLVEEYIQQGKFKKAGRVLKKLNEETDFLEGEISYFKGDFDKAIEFYKKVKPNSPFANDALARIIFVQSVEREELERYKTAEKLGYEGKYDKAISILKEIIKSSHKLNITPFSLFLIGELFYKKGDIPQAIGAYENIIKEHTESSLAPLAYIKMGVIYQKMGKKEKAREIYEEFILKFPKHALTPIIRGKLEEL